MRDCLRLLWFQAEMSNKSCNFPLVDSFVKAFKETGALRISMMFVTVLFGAFKKGW